MIFVWWIENGMDRSECGHALGHYERISSRDWRKPRNNRVMKDGFQTEIRIQYLEYTKHECYQFNRDAQWKYHTLCREFYNKNEYFCTSKTIMKMRVITATQCADWALHMLGADSVDFAGRWI
jgi:hypothetical protein